MSSFFRDVERRASRIWDGRLAASVVDGDKSSQLRIPILRLCTGTIRAYCAHGDSETLSCTGTRSSLGWV